eukprot:TRINITY_DN1983_c0_g2_i1.p1 TRINITY_DN1983_c0_g2~~TRINITY_DN1983_c0_g2_i1.p1  ORF type:complete len:734 (-),score=238.21 TRINITY_DN1983_c0_g2_i1:35-2236(-)
MLFVLERICVENEVFLEDLETSIEKSWASIGRIVSNAAKSFMIYKLFVNNFNKSSEILEDLKIRSESMRAFLQEDKPEFRGYSLNSLLILPIQRIPRYVLLINELLKHTEESHTDFPNLKQALKDMEDLAKHIDEEKHAIDQRLRLVAIHAAILDPKPAGLLAPHRRVESGVQANVYRVGSATALGEMDCYIFNDGILLATQLGTRDCIRAEAFLLFPFTISPLMRSNTLEIKTSHVEISEWCFRIEAGKDRFVVCCEGQEQIQLLRNEIEVTCGEWTHRNEVDAMGFFLPNQTPKDPMAPASAIFNITASNTTRENVNAEWATAFCNAFFAQNAHENVGHVRIGGKSVLPDAAAVFAGHLTQMANLHTVDLSDCISGQPESQALTVLSTMTSAITPSVLIHLNLSDNALGRKGFEACQGLIEPSLVRLERFYLDNIGMAKEAAEFLVEMVERACGGAQTKLVALHVYNNLLRDDGGQQIAKIIAMSPKMENVRVSANRFVKKNGVSAGGLAIAQSLLSTTSLISLDLADNSLGLKATEVLEKVISQQKALKSLSLADVGIDAEELICVTRALCKVASTITSVDLSCCELGPKGIARLSKIVKLLVNLERLGLNQTEAGNKGALALAQALAQDDVATKILEIGLEENAISAKGALPLIKALANKKKLKVVKLTGNFIAEDDKESLHDILGEDIIGTLSDNEEEQDEGDEDEDEDDQDEDDDGLADALGTLSVN